MDNWTIAFSPGDFECQATWGGQRCALVVPRGCILGWHPNYPMWCCLSCIVATVRQNVNSDVLARLVTQ